jgi:hypothetical protein
VPAALPARLLARPQPHREQAFAKLKALLRKAGARTREALMEAMGRALDAVTADDTRGFYPGLLRVPRLPSPGPIAMTDALGYWFTPIML